MASLNGKQNTTTKVYRTGTLDGEMGPYPVGTATLDGEMGPYPVGDQLFGTATLDGEMGPYPVGDKLFGATMDGEMGPYPVGDSTNLLGYAMSYGASDALTSLGGSGRNYGTTGPTTINTATSTTCSPMPNRRTAASGRGRRRDLGRAPAEGAPDGQEQSYQHQQQQHGIASRDSFRRHSAHGRIVCSAASERCSGDATRNTQMRTATCAPHHHHQQYDPTADDDDEDDLQQQQPPQRQHHSRHCSAGSSSRNTTPGTTRKCSDSLSRSRTSLRSETASSAGGHSHHHHHHHHRRQASSTSSTSCLLVARQTRTDDDETPEEEAAGTTATCNTEDERHPESASTLYVDNCHCSRGNLTTTTTTDDDEELQQYFINRSVSRRPSNVSSTSRVSHRSNRSTPRSGGGGGGSGGSTRSRQQSKRATPLSGVSCCSHHSHHSTQPQTYRSRGGPESPSFLQDSGSNATISNFNINPARFQCSYYTADESENSYCSISGENIRQIQAQTQIQTALEMRQKEHERIYRRPEQPAPPPPSRLHPHPLPSLPPADGGSDYNDSQQDVNSINGSILSIIESTSSDQPGGSTTTSTTTSTTQRQLQHVGERGGTKNGSSSGSQMILTPSKITIENIGQLSEIAANDYDFDDIDVSIPEMFHSPSKIKWNFLAGLEENKSNKSRISSISSLVDAASSGRGRSGTESGGADVSETASERRRDDSSDNDYSPNRIQHQPLPPVPTPPPQSSSSCKIEELLKKSSPSASSEFKTVSIWRAENDDEANAIIFHHESEIVENCCNNHFLDHSSYDICTVDNCDYLIKSSDTKSEGKGSIYSAKSEERLNNSVALSSSATNKLELKQRNIFTSTLHSTNTTPANVYSIISPDLKRFEKQTNLNRNSVNLSQNLSSPSSSSSSSIFLGNYNQTYRNINQNNGEDKLLNTSSSRSRLAPTVPPPPPPVATTSRSTTSGFNNATDAPPPEASPLEPAPPFSITAAASTATAAAASQFYNKSYHINLTAQNRLYFHAYSNAVREMEQCPHQSPSPTSIQSERSPQPCPQCAELYGSPFFYSSTNATNEEATGSGGTFADIANTSSSASLTGSGTGAGGRRGGARAGSVRWRRNVSHSLRINGLVRVVRTRARKCADYIRHKERLTQNRFHRRK